MNSALYAKPICKLRQFCKLQRDEDVVIALEFFRCIFVQRTGRWMMSGTH